MDRGLTDRLVFETVIPGSVRTARTVAAALTDGGAIGLVPSTSARTSSTGLGVSHALRPGLRGR